MDIEGLGKTDTFFVDLERYVGEVPPNPRLSMAVRLWLFIKQGCRSMPYVLGFRKPLAGFRNVDTTPSPR